MSIFNALRTLAEALESKSFFLCQSGGKVCLKKNHRYFYQIQGQMFCSNLNKADFVVWFSDTEPIYVETIFFDVSFRNEKMFPGLSFFYRRAILPEYHTRRVQNGKKLYMHHGGWLSLASFGFITKNGFFLPSMKKHNLTRSLK